MRRRDLITLATAAEAVAGAATAGTAVAAGTAGAASAAGAAAEPSIGFALGSGALHGWAHVGIVRGCIRLGLEPVAIAGSNIGAVIGALWAAGRDAGEITAVVQRLKWPSDGSPVAALLGGRRRNDALREEIDRAVGGRRIDELPVRFAAVASDAMSGESVVLDAGPAGLAVEASCAAPVWNEPVPIGNRRLLYGSLTAPVPVAAARRLGARRVVAVDVAFRPYEETPASTSDYAFQAVHILTNALAREHTRHAEHVLKLDVHHLMLKRLDIDALVEAGEAAVLRLGPQLVQR